MRHDTGSLDAVQQRLLISGRVRHLGLCLFELVSGNIHPDESLTRNGNMPPQKSHLALDQEIECFSKAGAISRTGRGLFSRFRGGACAHGSAVHAAIYGADLPVVDYVAFNGGFNTAAFLPGTACKENDGWKPLSDMSA